MSHIKCVTNLHNLCMKNLYKLTKFIWILIEYIKNIELSCTIDTKGWIFHLYSFKVEVHNFTDVNTKI